MGIACVNLPIISNVYGRLSRVVSDWLLVQNSRPLVEKSPSLQGKLLYSSVLFEPRLQDLFLHSVLNFFITTDRRKKSVNRYTVGQCCGSGSGTFTRSGSGQLRIRNEFEVKLR